MILDSAEDDIGLLSNKECTAWKFDETAHRLGKAIQTQTLIFVPTSDRKTPAAGIELLQFDHGALGGSICIATGKGEMRFQ
jgi:hypothetical protein